MKVVVHIYTQHESIKTVKSKLMEINQEEMEELESALMGVNKANVFRLETENGTLYLPNEVIGKSIIKLVFEEKEKKNE